MNLSLFEKHHIALKSPFLIIKGSKGVLGCGYLNLEALNRGGEAGAIVRGVNTHDDMLKAKVVAVSEAGSALGVEVGMLGEEALKRFQ